MTPPERRHVPERKGDEVGKRRRIRVGDVRDGGARGASPRAVGRRLDDASSGAADVLDGHREANDAVLVGDLEQVAVALRDADGDGELARPRKPDARCAELSAAQRPPGPAGVDAPHHPFREGREGAAERRVAREHGPRVVDPLALPAVRAEAEGLGRDLLAERVREGHLEKAGEPAPAFEYVFREIPQNRPREGVDLDHVDRRVVVRSCDPQLEVASGRGDPGANVQMDAISEAQQRQLARGADQAQARGRALRGSRRRPDERRQGDEDEEHGQVVSARRGHRFPPSSRGPQAYGVCLRARIPQRSYFFDGRLGRKVRT